MEGTRGRLLLQLIYFHIQELTGHSSQAQAVHSSLPKKQRSKHTIACKCHTCLHSEFTSNQRLLRCLRGVNAGSLSP